MDRDQLAKLMLDWFEKPIPNKEFPELAPRQCWVNGDIDSVILDGSGWNLRELADEILKAVASKG